MAFKFCPSCGTAVSVPEAKFCMNCGFNFTKFQQSTSEETRLVVSTLPNNNIPIVPQVSRDIFDMYTERFKTEVKQDILLVDEAKELILKCEMMKARDILSELAGRGYDRVEYLLSWIYSLNENGVYNDELAYEYCTVQPVDDVLRVLHIMNFYMDDEPKLFSELEEGIIPLLAELEQDQDVFAQLEVANYYLNKKSSHYNKDKGIRILEGVEKNGCWIASYFLGLIYMNVFKVEDIRKNADRAVIHFTRAAEAGSSIAAFVLGKMYFEGNEIRQNVKRAKKYLQLALERNEHEAKTILDEISKVETGKNAAAQQETEEQQTAQAEFAEKLQNFIDCLSQTYQIPCLYFANQNEKGNGKIINAIKAYAQESENELIICVFDDTLFGGADDGVLISNEALYVHNAFDSGRIRIPLADIASFRIESKNKNIWINDNTRIHLACCRGSADLQALIDIVSKVQEVFL